MIKGLSLAIPDMNLPFELDCGASNVGLGVPFTIYSFVEQQIVKTTLLPSADFLNQR